ncbi:MAG TPA: 4-hydroxy-3-methylbut-2-enyl diphosphate reductase [Candidatus Cloacimonadota bacterium]|nr:4-hydroxy-3-methylbut-2-enyl diphosphate reductase [Candidatus Cloacimonadota bacterium]
MNIWLAEHSGFCFGVRRAIQMAREAASVGKPVCTMGELIHNPIIVDQLKSEGIDVCEDPFSLRDHTVILRSHGVTKDMMETLARNGNRLVDATCPYVRRAQQLVESMSEAGYQVIIMGNADHPEVIGMLSWGNASTQVLKADDRPELTGGQQLCLISQTTEKPEHLADMVAWLAPRANELRVFNTICLATQQRQEASERLARKLDLVIVIGGLKSSNTRQLHQLCSQYSRCFQIESEADLQAEWFQEFNSIGLAAGASTPAETIVAVYNQIKEINGEPDRVTAVGEIPLFKEESC